MYVLLRLAHVKGKFHELIVAWPDVVFECLLSGTEDKTPLHIRNACPKQTATPSVMTQPRHKASKNTSGMTYICLRTINTSSIICAEMPKSQISSKRNNI